MKILVEKMSKLGLLIVYIVFNKGSQFYHFSFHTQDTPLDQSTLQGIQCKCVQGNSIYNQVLYK